MTTLLVDNYDSYTYNVFHLLAAVSGEEPIVVHNDTVSWKALSRWEFDAIVLSPGPGHPARWHDFALCADILRYSEIPVLGICLGHQGLGHVSGCEVSTAPMAMHGRLSQVHHEDEGLFASIPQRFSVVRYHSLAVTGSLGDICRVTAWTDDGVVMGIEHRSKPMWGVQFHPESIATECGHKLVENFYRLAAERPPPPRPRAKRPLVPPRRCKRRSEETQVSVKTRTLPGEPYGEPLFERLFGERTYAFWLDSADAPTNLAQWSFLGSTFGEKGHVIEYDVEDGIVTHHQAAGTRTEQASIFNVIDREQQSRLVQAPEGVALGLIGGYVGYLGYECKGDCGASNAHRSDVPDAVFMLANRVVAIDHETHQTHLLAVCDGDESEAETWLDEAQTAVREVLAGPPPAAEVPDGAAPEAGGGLVAGVPNGVGAHEEIAPVTFRVGRGREQYLADIARCKAVLGAGESYEVCLTDQIHADASPDPWRLYRILRRRNPSPFAAYLKLGEVSVVSSSPERFLGIDRNRYVQARPIKGTAKRVHDDPARDEQMRQGLLDDEKTFAEHLMIVDLLRNDLGRVCEVDTVRVPDYMIVESYATVHQLISNVTGVLEPGSTPAEGVRACFPGGSMTGAPKLRTMEIIDDIEREARGVYSGAIGYFSLDGSVDLSIVIRTIVLRPGATTIGAGGAIVIQSDAEEEFDEIMLKAKAPMSAIAQAVTGSDSPDAWTVELEPSLAGASS